ncbi:head-tail adaptor [Actinopolyspora alba]|uniref:Head-tail adaptor n=1 Tax=Actinopolyspora alba TaxID=673379 RepID=A0A1I2BFM4_9ACTN|nr:head-tail adaptor protein [Actinopolyspora alba]SFE54688.1 head-tail adaptor [Actinopolyspora alba]
MRRGITHRLIETATVERSVSTPDGAGGWTQTWQQVGTEPARLSQPHPAEQTTADRSEAQVSHDVYLQPDADVRRGDRLSLRGLVLEVAAVVEPSVPIYRKASCTSTQP